MIQPFFCCVRVFDAMKAAGALALLSVAGCASAPPTELLTLPTLPAPASAAVHWATAPTATTSATVLVVRRVGLPEYMDVNAVRYRSADATLAEWPRTAWAERPAVAITRELAARLRHALPGWTVCEGSCPGGLTGWVLQAEWSPLDYLRASQTLNAELRYSLAPPASAGAAVVSGAPAQMAVRRWAQPVAPDTPSGHAQAIAAALDDAAGAIVARLTPR